MEAGICRRDPLPGLPGDGSGITGLDGHILAKVPNPPRAARAAPAASPVMQEFTRAGQGVKTTLIMPSSFARNLA